MSYGPNRNSEAAAGRRMCAAPRFYGGAADGSFSAGTRTSACLPPGALTGLGVASRLHTSAYDEIGVLGQRVAEEVDGKFSGALCDSGAVADLRL